MIRISKGSAKETSAIKIKKMIKNKYDIRVGGLLFLLFPIKSSTFQRPAGRVFYLLRSPGNNTTFFPSIHRVKLLYQSFDGRAMDGGQGAQLAQQLQL